MEATHFMLLPDIVLLEIFTYLSCEDALYAFVNLHNHRLSSLLTEHGAFRQICLSSHLSLYRHDMLSNGIWRCDLVQSLVCKELFSDFMADLTPCRIFPLLSEIRLLSLRCSHESLIDFIIAHSSTLEKFSLVGSEQLYRLEDFSPFICTIVPHLSRLKLLHIDWTTHVSIQWDRLTDCLQSLKYLYTYVKNISDLYVLLVDGFLPLLQFLQIYMGNASRQTVSTEHLANTRLHMPNLKRFDLQIENERCKIQGEEQVNWTTIEDLISDSVMPCLRQFSFIYALSSDAEFRHIFQSFLYMNQKRNIRIQSGLYIKSSIFIDISNIFDIGFVRHNKFFVKINNEISSTLYRTWCITSWPSWATFRMDDDDIKPISGVRQLIIEVSNISIHSLHKLFPNANQLNFTRSASLSTTDSLVRPTPLFNVYRLMVNQVVPGLNLLLDGVMLPHLHSLNGNILPLFIAFASRTNQTTTLDTVNELIIRDHSDIAEMGFSFKQWCIVLGALPRLEKLMIVIFNSKCPPTEWADLLVDYVRQKVHMSLTLFSCCMNRTGDREKKEHFIMYLREKIELAYPPVQFASINSTSLDAWM